MRALSLMTFICLTVAAPAPAKTMVPVTACGQIVPRGAIGYLTADLDCSGQNDTMGVIVLPGSGLELRGFTITGGLFGVACYDVREKPGFPPGFYTGGTCRIDGGGGNIVASYAHGIGGTRVFVANLTIDGAGQEGISADTKIRIENVTVHGCLGTGVGAGGVSAVDSAVTGNGEYGIGARTLRMIGTTVTGNGVGPACSTTSPPYRCADLVAKHKPKLKESVCGSSLPPYNVSPRTPWGVCIND